MTGEHWSERMSAYLDGELSAADAAAAEEHLRVCDACQRQRDDFAAIRGWVRDQPARATSDPWPAIAGEIAAARRRRTRALRLAAAILLPMTVVAGAFWTDAGRWLERTSPRAGSASVTRPDEGVSMTIAALEGRFRDLERRLDPKTATAIRQGLAQLDDALTRAERELDRDRDNQLLEALVARVRQQKLRLLQSVTAS
jgi:anti-sigma factor RsiW